MKSLPDKPLVPHPLYQTCRVQVQTYGGPTAKKIEALGLIAKELKSAGFEVSVDTITKCLTAIRTTRHRNLESMLYANSPSKPKSNNTSTTKTRRR